MTDPLKPRILIACVGNIFLGDDGFGVEVARRLVGRALPPEVLVRDFGIRGLDLAYALMDRHELTILVDACQRGRAPGTVYLIKPDLLDGNASVPNAADMSAHGMNPTNALRMVKSMRIEVGRLLIVGCEPVDLGPEQEGKLGLSAAVLAAVEEAILLIDDLVSKTLHGDAVAAIQV
jgi:hydrogenase maturation protease